MVTAGEHPMHKHTGPFWIVSTSQWPEAATIFRNDYVRRDVVSIPAGGWARIRYVAGQLFCYMIHTRCIYISCDADVIVRGVHADCDGA